MSEKKSTKQTKIFRFIKLLVLTTMVIGFSTCGFLFVRFIGPFTEMRDEAINTSSNIKREDFRQNSNSYIYDKNGDLLFEIKNEKNLEYLDFNHIPQGVKDSFISVEDKRFYEHNGVDLQSILRAGISLIKNNGEITQGGSTITQQLVKLTYLTNEQTISRKIKEMILAREVEDKFSKKDILEFYINNVYFNNNAYGISAASQLYFNKSPKDLSYSEIAFLCAIPNSPNLYNPYLLKDGEPVNLNTISRRDKILSAMKDNNFITEEDYETAIKEEVSIAPKKESPSYDTRKNFVVQEVVHILMNQKGFKFKYAFNTYDEKDKYNKTYELSYADTLKQLYTQGYNIYTSFDDDLQKHVQEIVDNNLKGYTDTQYEIYKLQASSVTLDNKTGLILTMIGGRTSPKTDYLNRAYNSFRQNGSTMKPIGVYGPAFDILKYTQYTRKMDAQIQGGPKNYGSYYGNITIKKAIETSSNTIAHNVFNEVGAKKSMRYLQEMEFVNIVPDDMRSPAALGGLTLGTNPKEMAGAYSAIANNGNFNSPTSIVKITTLDDKTVYKHTPKNKRIYKEDTAKMLTDCLIGVIINGTARGYALANNIETAGKTGTTSDNKDSWFVGYSPIYTTAVWIGYDMPKELSSNIRGVILWKDIMNATHEGMSNIRFTSSNTNNNITNNKVPSIDSNNNVTKEPENPVKPEIPTTPETPVDPEKPIEPEKPVTPDIPDNPDIPEEPESPADPNEPEEPVEPEKPTEPENPQPPIKPEEPLPPTEPEKPTPPTDSKPPVDNGNIDSNSSNENDTNG